jgi:hypothetical protein
MPERRKIERVFDGMTFAFCNPELKFRSGGPANEPIQVLPSIGG